jgi:hypothetical protein
MPEQQPTLFISRRKLVICSRCSKEIKQGQKLLALDEKKKGVCEKCADLWALTLLPPGDVAMTRRSKKHSARTVVVMEWNNKRRRYNRLGQLVEPSAITAAKEECEQDRGKREEKQKKAAVKRAIDDKIYIDSFSQEIRKTFPNMPTSREQEVATHACEKYSGRVGRSAKAKEFDEEMITRAVVAHIRHKETAYDDMFGRGKRKREIRDDVKADISEVLRRWK